MTDIPYAIRGLVKSKVLSIVAIATLGIGIGAITIGFSVFSAVALTPLPFVEQDRLVDIHEASATQGCAGCGFGTSYPGYHDWLTQMRSVQSMGAYQEVPLNVSGAETPERIGGAIVSADVFRTLGVQPALGRDFEPADDRVGAAPVVVLSDILWRERYGADRRMLGQTIRVNGVAHTVIGVMPDRIRFPEFAKLWIPFEPNAERTPRSERMVGVVARLRDGIDLSQANAEAAAVAARIATEHPDTQREWTAAATPLRQEFGGTEKQLFGLMLGAVAFVLLIICANLAGLLLARGAGRQKEIAVRLAMGATRSRIVRQLLVESVLLALAGGVLGLVIAAWGIDAALASLSTPIPAWIEPRLDVTVFGFAIAASVATGCLFGIIPAIRASNPNVHGELKEGGHTTIGGPGRSKIRAALVATQIALTIVLLAGAGVFTKAVLRVSRSDAIDDGRGVLSARLELLDARYRDDAQLVTTMGALVTRAAALPGAKAAAASAFQFIAGFGATDQRIQVEGAKQVAPGTSPRFAQVVSAGYFGGVGPPISRGRGFDANDRAGAAGVAVINEAMAARLWAGEDPIGRRIKLGPDSLPWLTIVGVAANSSRPRKGLAASEVFLPFAQAPSARAHILVRASGDPHSLVAPLRALAKEIDRDTPLLDVMTMKEDFDRQHWPYRAMSLTAIGIATMALLLAVMGLYGVVAFATAQRSREIGVRIALGAQARDVVRLVTGQGAGAVFIGLAIGLVASTAVLRVLRSILWGGEPVDPVVFAGVSLLLVVVAMVAAYLPARRAAAIDPMSALRSD